MLERILKQRKKDAEPQLPYREDTDKYKVAKAFLTGENDKKKLMKQPGVENKEEKKKVRRKSRRKKEKVEKSPVS